MIRYDLFKIGMITKYRRKLMTYMQSNHVFASGIKELSFEEIAFVGGGEIGDEFDQPDASTPWDDALLGGQRDRQISGAQAAALVGLVAVAVLVTGGLAGAALAAAGLAVEATAVAAGTTAASGALGAAAGALGTAK